MINRLSEQALKNILNGKTKESFKCVIKFYSNKCEYCHKLKNDYVNISKQFSNNVHFFAFNALESDNLDDLISINGVPSIAFVKVQAKPEVSILDDPSSPSEETWYYPEDIVRFVEENLYD